MFMATCDMMNNVYGSELGVIVLVWWYLLVLVFGFWSRIGFQEILDFNKIHIQMDIRSLQSEMVLVNNQLLVTMNNMSSLREQN